MAEIDRTVFIRVVTLDPVTGTATPVPDARVTVQHRRTAWFDQTLSQGNPVTDRDGIAEVVLRFEETDESGLNPYFSLTLPEGLREVSGDTLDPLRPSFTLPGAWESRHDNASRIRNLTTDFGDRATPFTVYMGLGASLNLAYSDFRATNSNPIALPENALELVVIDEDIFFDDTLKGVGYNPRENRIIPFGRSEGDDRNDDRYPYFDRPPTVPYAMALTTAEAARPRAWIDPPGAPLGLIGGGSFEQVGWLATDAHGFVFMVDSAPGHPVIHRFYPDGTLGETLESWREGGSTRQFQQPRGLVVDRDRRLLVADDQSILVFRPSHEAARLDGNDQLPAGAGRYRFSHRWDQWMDFTAALPISQSFGQPQGMAVFQLPGDTDDYLAVADGGDAGPPVIAPAVHIFRLTGSTTANLTHQFTFAPGAGVVPVAVSGDRNGRLFLCSQAQHQVSAWQLENTSGWNATPLWTVGGTAGSANTAFDGPVALAVNANHNTVAIADVNNNRVQWLNIADGSWLVSWTAPYPEPAAQPVVPAGMAIDDRSTIYLADSGNQRVVRATPFAVGGTPQPTATPPRHELTWLPRTELPHLHQPGYVHLDGRGRLWVSDTGNNRVVGYERQGEGWQSVRVLGGLSEPVGIATSPTGEVFVVEAGANQVSQFDPTGDTAASTTAGFNDPQGIAYQQRGGGPVLYVADRGSRRVLSLGADGTSTPLTTGGNALADPSDLAVDSQGRLYVLDGGSRQILRFNADDAFDRRIDLSNAELKLPAPAGLSIAPDDRLLVCDRTGNRVVALTLQETATATTAHLDAHWDLQRFLPQGFYRRRTAAASGTAQFGGGLAARPAEEFLGLPAWRVTTGGTLQVATSGGGLSPAITLAPDDWIFVQNNGAVSANDTLCVVVDPNIYYPELGRHLLLSAPSRAVSDNMGMGLMVIADTGNHRVRLMRHSSTVNGNLFDLGLGLFEGYPDLYLRSHCRSDQRQQPEVKLRVAAGRDTSRFGNADRWQSPTGDEYTADTYTQTHRFTDTTPLKAMAINAVRVMQEVQRWLVHTTRQDRPDQRWGSDGQPDFLGVDVLAGKGSFHHWFANILSMGADEAGRGHDAWDDSTIAHEMGHWVFDYTPLRRHVEEIKARYTGGEHFANLLFDQAIALVEGYGEYIQLFWGSEFSGRDRLRGFPIADVSTLRRRGNTTPLPLYDQLNRGLEAEGYFANTLWQLHHLVADPAIGFADSPSYWWSYNSHLNSNQSQRLVELLRLPFRQFPDDDSSWSNTPNTHLFRQILAQARSSQPDFVDAIQQLYEINNQLMPKLRLRRLTGGNPGALVTSPLALAAGASANFVADVRDETDTPLVGYNLLFAVTGGGSVTLITPVSDPRRGRRLDTLRHAAERATDAQGEVRFTYQAPASAPATGNVDFQIIYQPHFYTYSDYPLPTDSRE
ncbi:MAG: NHL repeat-containing protein, partial [Nodosilinea sp.]